MTLCFIDCETTGLDARIHQPYEVCLWLDDEPEPNVYDLPHSLDHADAQALRIGRYFERHMAPWSDENNGHERRRLAHRLHGVTLVGSNPAFDAAMLTRFIGSPVWRHRMIDVAQGAMWVFGLSEPPGLAGAVNLCRDEGHDIPEPDHAAEGDVRTTRAVYYALRAIGGAA